MKQRLLIGLILTVFASISAFAGPVSSCTGSNGNIHCDLYETDPNGNPSEVGWAVPLNGPVTSGQVGLTDGTGISDILTFTSDTVQLTSGENLVCVDCYLIPENTSGPTTYNVGNIYVVFSDPEATPVPEPSSIALLGSGIFGLLGAARRKFMR